jgi:hypothetical protein
MRACDEPAMYGLTRNSVSRRAFARFPQSQRASAIPAEFSRWPESAPYSSSQLSPAPTPLHPLVNRLHSIAPQAHTAAHFLLTPNPIARKNTLVLWLLLKFSRLVRRPGLERNHSVDRKVRQGRLARVYSKALVEANKKICRRQDRVPRRLVGLSGWR